MEKRIFPRTHHTDTQTICCVEERKLNENVILFFQKLIFLFLIFEKKEKRKKTHAVVGFLV